MTGLLFSKRAVASILTYTLFCAFFLTTWSRYSYGGYSATIQEGRAGAEEMLKKRGASSISIAFVADGRVVWTQVTDVNYFSLLTTIKIPGFQLSRKSVPFGGR